MYGNVSFPLGNLYILDGVRMELSNICDLYECFSRYRMETCESSLNIHKKSSPAQ